MEGGAFGFAALEGQDDGDGKGTATSTANATAQQLQLQMRMAFGYAYKDDGESIGRDDKGRSASGEEELGRMGDDREKG